MKKELENNQNNLIIAEGKGLLDRIVSILEKDKTIVKYSVLKESEQLFASKYSLILPTEEELKQELDKEIRMVKEAQATYGKNNEE